MTLINSNVAKGQYAEYAVWKRLEPLGFSHIIRSYASHGPIDLLCSKGTGDLWAVQVKSSKHGSYLSAKELERLIEWSEKFHAKPIFAFKKKGKWIFKPLINAQGVCQSSHIEDKETGQDHTYSLGALLQEIREDEMNEL
jgi:Holliday junction resolvase